MPSLPAFVGLILPFLIYFQFLNTTWTAILVCLEHSFWITQQGSNSSDAFTKAWNLYLKQQSEDDLRSKESDDWFTMKHVASEEECAEFRKLVLDNRLRKSSCCLPRAG